MAGALLSLFLHPSAASGFLFLVLPIHKLCSELSSVKKYAALWSHTEPNQLRPNAIPAGLIET